MTDDLAAEGDRLHALMDEGDHLKYAPDVDPDEFRDFASDNWMEFTVGVRKVLASIAAALRERDDLRTSRDWWMTARSEAISLDLAAALRERDEAVTARKALVDQLPPLLAERDAALRERDDQIPLESENERLRVRAETAEARAETAEAEAEALAEDLASAEAQWGDEYLWKKWDQSASLNARRARLAARAATVEARHSRDEFHRLWERERVRAATAEADAALAWYWVDTLKDNTTCSEQREHLEADQAAHRARIAGAGAE